MSGCELDQPLTMADVEGVCDTPELCFVDGTVDWVRCGPCALLLLRGEGWDELDDGPEANSRQDPEEPCPRPRERG
jgi:hypothetical protein